MGYWRKFVTIITTVGKIKYSAVDEDANNNEEAGLGPIQNSSAGCAKDR